MHLIDPIADDPVPPISPRALIACDVSVSTILDLRSAANRVSANLTMEQLQSDTRDRAAYSACQNVAAAAQLWTELPADPCKPGTGRHLRVVP
jgi:hypothetical protein